MYTLINAYGVGKNINARWGVATVGTLPMNELFGTYRKLYLTLTAPFLVDNIHIDFEYLRSKYLASAETLNDVLLGLGNDTLPTIAEVPQYDTKFMEYNDARRARYKVDVQVPGGHPSTIAMPEDKTEVVVTHPTRSMQDVFDYCLCTINGFFHRTDTDGEKLYVLDGGKSMLKSRRNDIGFHSFEAISKIKSYPITPSMVYGGGGNSFLHHKAFFDLSHLDIEGKTVLFVIAGYLYLPFKNELQQINDKNFMIDFNNVPVVERFYESAPYIDYASLGLPKKVNYPDQINLAEFYKDENFMKYLTHKNSFVVVVDSPRMFSEEHHVKTRVAPGHYITYQDATQPLVTANGRVAEYWKKREINQWSLFISDAYYHNRQARSVDPANLITTSGASQPHRTYSNSLGYLLSLGADVLVTP